MIPETERVVVRLVIEAGLLAANHAEAHLSEVAAGRRPPGQLLQLLGQSGRASPAQLQQIQQRAKVLTAAPPMPSPAQSSPGPGDPLSILLARGVINEGQAEHVRRGLAMWRGQGRQASARDAIIALGLCTPEQLDAALASSQPQPGGMPPPPMAGDNTRTMAVEAAPGYGSEFIRPARASGPHSNQDRGGFSPVAPPASAMNPGLAGSMGGGLANSMGGGMPGIPPPPPPAAVPYDPYASVAAGNDHPPPIGLPGQASPFMSGAGTDPFASAAAPGMAQPAGFPPSSSAPPATRADSDGHTESRLSVRSARNPRVPQPATKKDKKSKKGKDKDKGKNKRKARGQPNLLPFAILGGGVLIALGLVLIFLVLPTRAAKSQLSAALEQRADGQLFEALETLEAIDPSFTPDEVPDLREAIRKQIQDRTSASITKLRKLIRNGKLKTAKKGIKEAVQKALDEDRKRVKALLPLVATAKKVTEIRKLIEKRKFADAISAARKLDAKTLLDDDKRIEDEATQAQRDAIATARRNALEKARAGRPEDARQILEELSGNCDASAARILDDARQDIEQIVARAKRERESKSVGAQLNKLIRARRFPEALKLIASIPKDKQSPQIKALQGKIMAYYQQQISRKVQQAMSLARQGKLAEGNKIIDDLVKGSLGPVRLHPSIAPKIKAQLAAAAKGGS